MSSEQTRKIRRLLVANRGEIAVRIIRACRQMGIETVAVVSEADLFCLHAQLADQVVEIGGAPPTESYLKMDRVIQAALDSGADAIHPGYGFLAENAAFAEEVTRAGLIFVGPSPEVIEEMGVKTKARQRMSAAGVAVVPGIELGTDGDGESWTKAAAEVGYPLLVKAAAGGGGKGMRIVEKAADLVGAIGAAQREAASAFGDATVYLERLLIRPRHVEVQVLGDSHGNVIHLGARDCSIQRRHQKIIEESPPPCLPEETFEAMTRSAVQAASAIGYVGAGTVEMLLDSGGDFFFLEMNTRLQVEHPVTEMVTGVDLVAQQIRVAEGHALDIRQEDIHIHGHSIEARLYAEDPARGSLPQTGEVLLFEPPSGPSVRVDTGIITGSEVSLHYDPMIAKISVWGRNREQAIARLIEALSETVLLGPVTNLAYLLDILGVEAFAEGEVHTGFLPEHLDGWPAGANVNESREQALLLAAAAIFSGGAHTRESSNGQSVASGPPPGLWSTLGPFRLVEGRSR